MYSLNMSTNVEKSERERERKRESRRRISKVQSERELISYPDVCLRKKQTSGKIGHVLQSDWPMKMARCKSRQPFSPLLRTSEDPWLTKDFIVSIVCARPIEPEISQFMWRHKFTPCLQFSPMRAKIDTILSTLLASTLLNHKHFCRGIHP